MKILHLSDTHNCHRRLRGFVVALVERLKVKNASDLG